MYPDFNMNNQYYGFNDFNSREDFAFRNPNQPNMYNNEIITLNQAIDLIRQSVRNEREDEYVKKESVSGQNDFIRD